jgi:hypothetical protein
MCCENFFPFPVDVTMKLSSSPSVIPAEAKRQRSAEPGPIPPPARMDVIASVESQTLGNLVDRT